MAKVPLIALHPDPARAGMTRVTEDYRMALGKRPDSAQQPLFVSAVEAVANAPAHPYYDAVNKVLAAHHFDRFVEDRCAEFYAKKMGRPGLPPGR